MTGKRKISKKNTALTPKLKTKKTIQKRTNLLNSAKSHLSTKSKSKISTANQRQYENLIELLNNTTLAVIEWDKDSKVTYWNKQAESIFGWSEKEVIGQNINEKIVLAEDKENMLQNVKQLLKSGVKTNTNENRNVTKGNKIIFCQWFNSILRDKNGKVTSVLSLVQDKTVNKFSEIEKEKAIYNLNERVKELSLLNIISRILQDTESSLDIVLKNIVKELPNGWQYPEITSCCIIYGDKIILSDNYFENSKWKQSNEFNTNSGKKVKIEIIYNSQKPDEFEGPFLKEERTLLEMISSMVKSYLDNKHFDEERKRLLNDLIQRNISLEKFAFVVSHNLRAPIANILSISELLCDSTVESNIKYELLMDLNTSVKKFDSVFKFLISLLETNEKT